MILDNLTSLIETGNIYTPDTARTIFDWLRTVTEKGVSVVIVHHTLDDGKAEARGNKMRGSDEWRIRCQTEIQLINKHEIAMMKTLPQEVYDFAKKDGATIGMYFKSCKASPCVTDKIVWLHLALGDSKWERICVTDKEGGVLSPAMKVSQAAVDTNITVESMIGQSQSNVASSSFLEPEQPEELTSDDASDLSKKEQEVLSMAAEKGMFNRGDIDELLNCKESTSQKVLKSLLDKCKIVKEGEGKNTTYSAI